MTGGNWSDLTIKGDHSEPANLGERFEVLRKEIAEGRIDTALDEGLGLADSLLASGHDLEALAIIDELGSLIVLSELQPEQWAWFLNARGTALSRLGRYREAEIQFGRMADLAERLQPGSVAQLIFATSLQNRGIVAAESRDPERAVLLLREALPIVRELGQWAAVVDVLAALALAVAEQEDLEEAENLLGIAEQVARLLRDRRRVGAVVGNRGIVRSRRGDFVGAEKVFRIALRHARLERDPMRELLSIVNVGASLEDQGLYGNALRWYRRGARRAIQVHLADMGAQLLRHVARVLVRTGRAREAIPELEDGLGLARDSGHPLSLAECLSDLAALRVELGDDKQAEVELQAARQQFVTLGEEVWEARVLANLAELAVRRKSLDDADHLWSAAVDLLNGDPHTAVAIARRAAELWSAEGDQLAAERWIGVELGTAGRVDEGASMAWRVATAGALLNWPRSSESGVRLLEDAIQRYDDLSSQRDACRVRLDLAVALSDLERHSEATVELERCLSFVAQQSDRVLRQHVLVNLGEVTRRQGEFGLALTYLEESVKLARDLEDMEALAHSLGILGLCQLNGDDLESARSSFGEQLKLGRERRDRGAEASALGGLGNIDFLAGKYVRAATRYRRAAELNANAFPVGEIEDLGAWLQSLAAGGKHDQTHEVAQRLVARAQVMGLESKAADALSSSAEHLLASGMRDEAAALYAAAVLVDLTQLTGKHDFAERAGQILGRRLGHLVSYVEGELPQASRETFYGLVLAALRQSRKGLDKRLRPYLDEVRRALKGAGRSEA